MPKERIDKLLSHQGFGSRKDIKRLLRSAEVLLNGKRIYDPSLGIDPDSDELSVDGEPVTIVKNITLMMNKIAHTVSANKDGEHQTVFDLLAPEYRTPYLQDKLHLVGRLDMDTEGLLLFTTDGALTHRLISPKSHIDKTYFVMLEREFSEQEQADVSRRFEEGIAVGPDDNDPGFTCEPARVRFPSQEEIDAALEKSSVGEVCDRLWEGDAEMLRRPARFAILTIYEGKYHQVKRMFTAAGNKVVFLKRLAMGQLLLDKKLAPGEYRKLSDEELELLS
ncbi:pseudouridine synthase [Treponema sp. C6A8]|uniref:pseudouridine synthase n=1 Tax=Treponema sp. C6A8 TaxID=1410609 RepID=UPI0004806473|nr:pseudouridine synthase [Treponema sp. C6A8]